MMLFDVAAVTADVTTINRNVEPSARPDGALSGAASRKTEKPIAKSITTEAANRFILISKRFGCHEGTTAEVWRGASRRSASSA